ncbi:hypothetical protein MARVELLAND_40 [Bacillus phage vB_BspM_MarvelLand]|nr:hypothetical protein MARVELLAND_40 [Bacillus phage vB_BspM_MarvelLand]
MSKKHEKDFLYVTRPLAKALSHLAHLERGIHTGNVDVDSPDVYNVITEAKELLDESIKAIHDIEDRKQEEAMANIPNFDSLFKGNPVNEYVDAILAVIAPQHPTDGVNPYKLIKDVHDAAVKLAESQRKAEEAVQEDKSPKPKTEEEFIHYVTDSLDLAHPGLAESYKEALKMGIEELKRHGGGAAPFMIPLKSGVAYGKLRISNGKIGMKLGGTEYVFDPKEVEEYSAEAAAVEPVPCPAEDQVVPCTCDDKADCSKPCERDVIVDLAIAHLTDKKEFTGSDYDLIRYFLRVVENAADEEVNTLSNRALELAWKRHWYLRNEN